MSKYYGYNCTVCGDPIKEPQATEHTDTGLSHAECCRPKRGKTKRQTRNLLSKSQDEMTSSQQQVVRPRRGQFYKGVEWLACWLLDNVEGETITEEQLRPWAAKAWEEHLKRSNSALCDPAHGDAGKPETF